MCTILAKDHCTIGKQFVRSASQKQVEEGNFAFLDSLSFAEAK